MNPQELFRWLFSAMVNQALINQNNETEPLPPDQQEALKKILDAIYDIRENNSKIRPEYQQRVVDAVVLKIASESGWSNGGMK